MANVAYQVTGLAYQGSGQFAYQGSTDETAGQNPWDTSQGVAGNLARNLARFQRQDCEVRVRCEPVPAGSNHEAQVQATSFAAVAPSGATAGAGAAQPQSRGIHAAARPDECGAECGAVAAADFESDCEASCKPCPGLKVGGGRVRFNASSQSIAVGGPLAAGSSTTASAKTVRNPTDEQLMMIAAMATRVRRLTATSRRL